MFAVTVLQDRSRFSLAIGNCSRQRGYSNLVGDGGIGAAFKENTEGLRPTPGGCEMESGRSRFPVPRIDLGAFGQKKRTR